MSFKLVDELPVVEWPVKCKVPVNGGKYETHIFIGLFRQISDEENLSLLRDQVDGSDVDPLRPLFEKQIGDVESGIEYENALLDATWVGFKNVEAHDKTPLESNDENMANLRGISYVRHALAKASQEIKAGERTKN